MLVGRMESRSKDTEIGGKSKKKLSSASFFDKKSSSSLVYAKIGELHRIFILTNH